MKTETHPFEPFLPAHTRILMAGTFPPQPHRWAMNFYYPNRTNSMWEIWGLIGFNDKEYFIDRANKGYFEDKIKDYCRKIGLGLTDTGYEIHRQKDNASDKYLSILKPFDFESILSKIPECHSIIVTGELAGETLRGIVGCEPLKIGVPQHIFYKGRELVIWRCPSSSRAYPLALEKKASYYRDVLEYENSRTEKIQD